MLGQKSDSTTGIATRPERRLTVVNTQLDAFDVLWRQNIEGCDEAALLALAEDYEVMRKEFGRMARYDMEDMCDRRTDALLDALDEIYNVRPAPSAA